MKIGGNPDGGGGGGALRKKKLHSLPVVTLVWLVSEASINGFQ